MTTGTVVRSSADGDCFFLFEISMGRRTAEEDGKGFVEDLRGVRVEDVASFQLPWLWEACTSRRTHHSPPDAKCFWS